MLRRDGLRAACPGSICRRRGSFGRRRACCGLGPFRGRRCVPVGSAVRLARTATLVDQLVTVVAELVAPVLASERPELVLVVDGDGDHVARLAIAGLDLLRLEVLFLLALLTLEDFELDLDH